MGASVSSGSKLSTSALARTRAGGDKESRDRKNRKYKKRKKTYLPIVRPCPLDLGGEVREVGSDRDVVHVGDEPGGEEFGEGGGLDECEHNYGAVRRTKA